jgi:hypothetical protein
VLVFDDSASSFPVTDHQPAEKQIHRTCYAEIDDWRSLGVTPLLCVELSLGRCNIPNRHPTFYFRSRKFPVSEAKYLHQLIRLTRLRMAKIEHWRSSAA